MFFKGQHIVISTFIKVTKERKGMIYYCGDSSEIFLDIKDGKEGEMRQRQRTKTDCQKWI